MAAPIQRSVIISSKLELCCTAFRQAIFCRYVTKAQDDVPKKKKGFIDSLRIYVRGGAGGQGFPRYGGLGGRGGNVNITTKKGVSLKDVRSRNIKKRFVAANGENSRKFRLIGESGKDLDVVVPVGVVVKTDKGRQLGDLDQADQTITVARGGKGGNPDNGFLGLRGESREITLDLKLIADAGLVGFPNAGKSTFLGAVSRTNPKIGEYPFTTIKPQIGTVHYEDLRKITVADLPGLIEGAHQNFGMGHKFLKHVERTKVLIMMVDINGFSLGVKYSHRSAFENILLLNKELELYQQDLVHRPTLLLLNKTDSDENGEKLRQVLHDVQTYPESMANIDHPFRPQTFIKFDGIFPISAKNNTGLDVVKEKLRFVLDYHAEMSRTVVKSSDVHDDRHRETMRTTLV